MTPLLIDLVAALAEIAGCFAFWSHLRAGPADLLFSPRKS